MEDSPIWADGSTEEYASELEEALGGAARLAELTGSRAHLRQGAPQIMKVRRLFVWCLFGVVVRGGGWPPPCMCAVLFAVGALVKRTLNSFCRCRFYFRVFFCFSAIED